MANAAAIAARHPKWDERPVVIVQRHLRMEVTEDEILACYRGKVPNWQIPDRVLFIDNLPLGATGHIDAALLAPLPETLWMRIGNWPVLLAAFAALLAAIRRKRFPA